MKSRSKRKKKNYFWSRVPNIKIHSRYHQTGSKHKIAEQRETNPFDRNGRRKKCAICGSVFHWAEDCSHKRQKQEENEEKCNLALFTKEHKPENEILLTDFLDVQSLIQHVPRLYEEKDSMKNTALAKSISPLANANKTRVGLIETS